MPKAPRKLKVFETQLGFFQAIVAVPSRAAALRAWGVRQDLFKEGFARVSTDPDIIAAANAQPGIVLRRPSESHDAFARDPNGLPAPPSRKAAKAKPPPDRKPLDRAEAALRSLEAAQRKDEAAFKRRRTALETAAAASKAKAQAAHKAAAAKVADARKAYRRAGGKDL